MSLISPAPAPPRSAFEIGGKLRFIYKVLPNLLVQIQVIPILYNESVADYKDITNTRGYDEVMNTSHSERE